ncbi:MAG: NuoM family protein [bacterium]
MANLFGINLLTLMTFIPTIVALFLVMVPSRKETLIKSVGLGTTAVPLLMSIPLYLGFDGDVANYQFMQDFQFVVKTDWIGAYNIQYYLGVDGLSVTLALLSTLLFFVAMLVSWHIEEKIKAYTCLLLLLETGVLGTFFALDLFLFFVFWELTLLPMYFLIGIWGGPRREYAAIKFFLYTMFGSVLMLLGIIAMYFEAGSFSIPAMFALDNVSIISPKILYLLFGIGFAVKIPIFPFHTWLPDAHVEAPTPISVILAGILLKMGAYGFFRIAFPLFPEAAVYFGWLLALLGLINIIYGSLCAMAQDDLKKLVAYSSIGHMGYMLLGMASFIEIGLIGGHFQMFTHGLSSGLLFLLVGVVYQRAHHRDISRFGGLASQMPRYAAFMMLATFAGLGLPSLAPFVSEALSFVGAFYSPITRVYAIIGLSGILLTASYMLWMYQRVFFGEVNEENEELPDINWREMGAAAPLMVLLVFLGVYPMAYFNLVQQPLVQLHNLFEPLVK